MGVDMRESRLKQLPAFKLIDKKIWANYETKGMVF